jgi:DNA-directed RNA polymerase subunit RPC12/RpoP
MSSQYTSTCPECNGDIKLIDEIKGLYECIGCGNKYKLMNDELVNINELDEDQINEEVDIDQDISVEE